MLEIEKKVEGHVARDVESKTKCTKTTKDFCSVLEVKKKLARTEEKANVILLNTSSEGENTETKGHSE